MNEINSLNDIRALVAFSTVNGEDAAGLMKFIQSDVRLEKIKENPKRSIFRMTDENGRMLYLKLFGKQKFPFNVIRFYAAKEYRIAKALQKASVPIINYLAWATLKNGGGFCVSEGLPQAVSGRQYFFQTARFDVIFFPEFRKVEMCSPWMELQDYLTDDEIMEGLLSSSLAKNKFAALELMDRARAAYRRQEELRWPKTKRRILSGRAKFTTLETRGSDRYYWRHTQWFTPPEQFEVDPAWEMKSYPAAEAEKIWLDSFRKYQKELPLLRVVHPDNSSDLYFSSKSNTTGR